MPGTKRTHSFAFPGENESKRSKHKSRVRVSASAPLDVGSSTLPALRRASTLTADDDAGPSGKKTLKSKKSLTNPSTLTRQSCSFVDEGVLVTRLSGLRSGSVVGETSAASAKLTSKKSLSKFESIRVTAVDETELAAAVSGLESHLSKDGSKSSVVSVPSLSALKKLPSVKSAASKDGNSDDMDISGASTSEDRAHNAPFPPDGLLELAISFDTTGSMFGCLEEVRAKVQDLVQRLQADIPGIRIAVIAHGDYCDVDNYIIKWVDFGASVPDLCEFVKNVSRTRGGDPPECYELVLQRARQVLTWTPGSQRVLVMIGDNLPHPVGYKYNRRTYNIDWRAECHLLKDMNVKIYSVRAGNALKADGFYIEMARITGGCKLDLKTFSSMFDFLMMICYREANPDMLAIYQQEILDREGRLADDVNAMTKTFDFASKTSPSKKLAVDKKTAVAKKVITAKKSIVAKDLADGKKATVVTKNERGKTPVPTKRPGVLVTRLTGLRSGSVVGETCAANADFITKGSLSKSESIRVRSIDETELTTAVMCLKSYLSKTGSKSPLYYVPSLSVLKTLLPVESPARPDGGADDMDTSGASISDDRALPPGGLLELAISFDTTGYMFGCIKEVSAKIQIIVQRLQTDIPGIRIAILAHGDYFDRKNYIVKWVDFGASVPELCDFVKNVSKTYGGDYPECYELVLQRAREVLTWTPGSQRVLIMIGDDNPHPVGYHYRGNIYNIDWREECHLLNDMNVKIYAVQKLGRTLADEFYKEMARITGGCRLTLKKFNSMFVFLMMICYREANPDMLAIYQQDILEREGRLADDIDAMTKTFDVASKTTTSKKLVVEKKTGVAKTASVAKKPPAAKKLVVARKALAAKEAPVPRKRPIATKATHADTTTRAKKGVKTLTKTAKDFGSKTKTNKRVKKATHTKKNALRKIVQKREKLGDTCMTTGPLKQLTWTNWERAVVPSMPKSKQKSKYSKLRVNNGYAPNQIFDNTFEQRAIYEIAVQLPGKRSTRKYPIYMLSKFGFRRVYHWATHILRHQKIRVEVNNILTQGCSIYIRRGVLSAKLSDYAQKVQLEPIETYIRHNYDYAWNKYIWRRTPSAGKSFTLTHRQVNMRRGDTTYNLSNSSL